MSGVSGVSGRGSDHHDQTEEEDDLLRRSKRRKKGTDVGGTSNMVGVEGDSGVKERYKNFSYKDAAMGFKMNSHLTGSDEADDGAIYDDDVIEESTDPSWFGIGMTREDKWRARKPWWNSLIIKLVGRSIGCHYH